MGGRQAKGERRKEKFRQRKQQLLAAPLGEKRAQSFLEFESGSVRFEGGAQGWF